MQVDVITIRPGVHGFPSIRDVHPAMCYGLEKLFIRDPRVADLVLLHIHSFLGNRDSADNERFSLAVNHSKGKGSAWLMTMALGWTCNT